jgi:aminopeptidase N
MKPLQYYAAASAILLSTAGLYAQDRRTQIDVISYKIDATVDPAQQTLSAAAAVTFAPQEEAISATFELHNSLQITGVTDSAGRQLRTSRTLQDFSVRVDFQQPQPKGTPVTLNMAWEGRLSGKEESPIYGLTFGAIGRDRSYLLYPSRWFPVSGYTADRFAMDLTVIVPAGYKVVSSGIESVQGQRFTFQTTRHGFPGSLAVVQGSAQRVSSQGITSDVWFAPANAAQAQPWGDEVGKAMTFLTTIFGLAPQSTLAIVETGEGAPTAYSVPGMLFVSSAAAARQPSPRVLANQLTRQWFGSLISPTNRNHIWLSNGIARYMELMYLEQINGPSILEGEIRDLYVDALTATDAPVLQAARFEDYSPEFFAVTGSKGAATLHMLRWVLGDDKFKKVLNDFANRYANQSASTDDLRKLAEAAAGEPLQGFFIQWLESTGAPEFKIEYVVYRTQKGFRVVGKITQDLDTFRMPVELKIETEGNPEFKRVDVAGPSTEFVVETFGKPRKIIVDPNGRMLRLSPQMRVAVAIRRGEQFAEIGEYTEALKEYQRALEVNRISSLAHYRVGEVFFLQGNYQSAANEFREALNGDGEPKWTEVWSHINLGKIFDITNQRERARNAYQQAIRTRDNTQGAQEEAAKYLQTPYQRESRQ